MRDSQLYWRVPGEVYTRQSDREIVIDTNLSLLSALLFYAPQGQESAHIRVRIS